jgi:AraC-like DNA-binding protein
VRSGLAVGLLATDLSLDEVALRLGYAEASSFIHAHRRWTGRTPRQAAEAD